MKKVFVLIALMFLLNAYLVFGQEIDYADPEQIKDMTAEDLAQLETSDLVTVLRTSPSLASRLNDGDVARALEGDAFLSISLNNQDLARGLNNKPYLVKNLNILPEIDRRASTNIDILNNNPTILAEWTDAHNFGIESGLNLKNYDVTTGIVSTEEVSFKINDIKNFPRTFTTLTSEGLKITSQEGDGFADGVFTGDVEVDFQTKEISSDGSFLYENNNLDCSGLCKIHASEDCSGGMCMVTLRVEGIEGIFTGKDGKELNIGPGSKLALDGQGDLFVPKGGIASINDISIPKEGDALIADIHVYTSEPAGGFKKPFVFIGESIKVACDETCSIEVPHGVFGVVGEGVSLSPVRGSVELLQTPEGLAAITLGNVKITNGPYTLISSGIPGVENLVYLQPSGEEGELVTMTTSFEDSEGNPITTADGGDLFADMGPDGSSFGSYSCPTPTGAAVINFVGEKRTFTLNRNEITGMPTAIGVQVCVMNSIVSFWGKKKLTPKEVRRNAEETGYIEERALYRIAERGGITYYATTMKLAPKYTGSEEYQLLDNEGNVIEGARYVIDALGNEFYELGSGEKGMFSDETILIFEEPVEEMPTMQNPHGGGYAYVGEPAGDTIPVEIQMSGIYRLVYLPGEQEPAYQITGNELIHNGKPYVISVDKAGRKVLVPR